MASIEALAMAGVDCDTVAIDIDALEKKVPPHLLACYYEDSDDDGGVGDDGGVREVALDLNGSEEEVKARLIVWAKTVARLVQEKFQTAFGMAR